MDVFKILIVRFILIMSGGVVCAAENIVDDAMGDDSKELLETVQEDITTDVCSNILKPLRMIAMSQVKIHSPTYLMK